jgi:hypothetical protein
MVVLPRVVVKVELPLVSTDTIADVVTADEDPPAPPAPKIVVLPIVFVISDDPEVSTETMADVVIALEEPPEPPEPPAPPA